MSRYKVVRNFIELDAAVHELSCKQRNRERKKNRGNAENDTAFASAISNNA